MNYTFWWHPNPVAKSGVMFTIFIDRTGVCSLIRKGAKAGFWKLPKVQ